MTELDVQIQVADYLRLHYPSVLFHSDFGSGLKLTIGQARKQYRLQGGRRAWPDMFIAEPKAQPLDLSKGSPYRPLMDLAMYAGLMIELKKDGEKLHPGPRAKNRFKSIDGKEYKTEHLMEQADVLYKLRQAGYAAKFAIGLDEAKEIIDEYLGGPEVEEVEF